MSYYKSQKVTVNGDETTYEDVEISLDDIVEEVYVPQSITPRQFKLALFQLFQITPQAIEAFLSTLPEPDQTAAFISWFGASTFDRENEMVNVFAYVFALTHADLDQVFITGITL